MIQSRFGQLALRFFLSIFISCIVSGVAVLNTTGFVDSFLSLWLASWFKSWVIAFLAILIVAPLTRRLFEKIIKIAYGYLSAILLFFRVLSPKAWRLIVNGNSATIVSCKK